MTQLLWNIRNEFSQTLERWWWHLFWLQILISLPIWAKWPFLGLLFSRQWRFWNTKIFTCLSVVVVVVVVVVFNKSNPTFLSGWLPSVLVPWCGEGLWICGSTVLGSLESVRLNGQIDWQALQISHLVCSLVGQRCSEVWRTFTTRTSQSITALIA